MDPEFEDFLVNELTQNEINELKFNRIYSATNFLDKQNFKNLSLINKQKLKNLDVKLVRKYDYSSAYNLYLSQNKITLIYSTGFENLDKLLNGGFTPSLIEVCGLSGIGKSVFCKNIAANFVKNYNFDVIYINTNSSFNVNTIQQYFLNQNFGNTQILTFMKRIKYKSILTGDELITYLTKLLMYIKNHETEEYKYKLLIIDSLSSILYNYLGEKSFKGKYISTKIKNILDKLVIETGIVVVTVNILIPLWEDSEDECTLNNFQINAIKLIPAMGKNWEHSTRLRLHLDHVNETFSIPLNIQLGLRNTNENNRKINILHSNYHKINESCIIELFKL